MKHIAYVVNNNQEDTNIPYKGCIKVVAPTLFGYIDSIAKSDKEAEIINKMVISDWIYPCYSHPSDTYIPELGECVFIENIQGTNKYIYSGSFPGKDFANLFVKDKPDMDGFNPNFVYEKGVNKTRIIGTRYGSYILLEDTWANEIFADNDKFGKIIIEAGGKNKQHDDRLGPYIILNSEFEKENIEICARKPDGTTMATIFFDVTKDAEKIIISSFGKDDKGYKEIAIDNENDAIEISGSNLEDKGGQSVLLDFKNEKIEITGKNKDDEKPQSWLMDLLNKKTIFTDPESQKITIDGGDSPKISIIDKASQEITLNAASGSEGVLIKSGDNTSISMKKDGSETLVKNGANQSIKMTSSETVVQADATKNITFSSTGIKIATATQNIEFGAASIKIAGVAGTIEVM